MYRGGAQHVEDRRDGAAQRELRAFACDVAEQLVGDALHLRRRAHPEREQRAHAGQLLGDLTVLRDHVGDQLVHETRNHAGEQRAVGEPLEPPLVGRVHREDLGEQVGDRFPVDDGLERVVVVCGVVMDRIGDHRDRILDQLAADGEVRDHPHRLLDGGAVYHLVEPVVLGDREYFADVAVDQPRAVARR